MAAVLDTPLSAETLGGLHMDKLFAAKERVPISSVCHTLSGSHFLTTLPNGTLTLYGTARPKVAKTTYSKKYGCGTAAFTARGGEGATPQSCVVASSIPAGADAKANHAIRMLDLNTNAFAKYFVGHQEQVLGLWAAPWTSEGFVSAAMDGTIKVWDQRAEGAIASANLHCRTELVAACDTTGMVMAIWEPKTGVLAGTIRLVSTSDFPEGIIATLNVTRAEVGADTRLESLKFTPSGLLLLGFVNADILVVDSMSMRVVSRLTGRSTFGETPNDVWRASGPLDVSWDGNWAFGGSGNGTIAVWDLKRTTNPVVPPARKIVTGEHNPRVVVTNPRFGIVVSCDTDVAFYNLH